jgi:hypothetical protein
MTALSQFNQHEAKIIYNNRQVNKSNDSVQNFKPVERAAERLIRAKEYAQNQATISLEIFCRFQQIKICGDHRY